MTYFKSQGAVSIRKTVLPGMAIPMLKIRRPNGRLIFNMGIPIPGKDGLYIETGPWWFLMNTGAKIFQLVLVSSMTGLLIHIFKNLTPGLAKPLTYPRIREITHSTQSQDSISNWYPYSMKPGVTIIYILLRFLAATAMCDWCKRHHRLWLTLLQEIDIDCQDDIKSNMWNTFEILSDIMIILSWYKMHGPLSCSR